MVAYKDYIQDDSQPFGVGHFVLDDDSSHYLDDPERARSVLEQIYGQEASNIATSGSADGHGGPLSKKDQLGNAIAKLAGTPEPNKPFRGIDPGPDPMRRAVAGPGGGDDSLMSTEENQSSLAPTESREPERRAPSREEVQNAAAADNLAQAYSLVPRVKPGTDPRTLGPGVSVDKSYSREGGLSPDEYNRQAADRQSVYDASNQTIARHYQEDQAASDAQAQLARAQALQLKQQNDAREHELARKQTQYQDDRAWLEKDVDAWYDKKPDPDGGLGKERGLVGNIGSAIAQFMGAYAAVISGSPNFANQILNRKIDEHVNAQVEEFRRGRMKRDGQMQRMAERGMSLEQMKSALRLQQELALQKEVQAAALNEGSREAKQAAESLLMDRQERFTTEENKFRTEALGKQTVSGDIVRPTGPKQKTPLEYQKDVADMLALRNRITHEAAGGDYADKADERQYQRSKDAEDRLDKRAEREGKVTDEQAKAESAWNTIEAYGDAAGIKKDPKTGNRVANQGLFSSDTMIAPGQREGINDLTGQGKPIEAARRAATEGIGRLQSGGVISPSEAETFTKLLGDEHATRAQIATNLNALRVLIQSRRSTANQERPLGAPSSWKRENER